MPVDFLPKYTPIFEYWQKDMDNEQSERTPDEIYASTLVLKMR